MSFEFSSVPAFGYSKLSLVLATVSSYPCFLIAKDRPG